MLITKLFNSKMCLLEKVAVKLVQCCAVFEQSHVVYCGVCETVDGTYFVRNLKRGLS